MARYPHELRRDGLFSVTWTLKGPLLAGTYRPPTAERPGVYQSRTLRLTYRPSANDRNTLDFMSPRLSRMGDRVDGEVRLGRTTRRVWVRSNGTGEDGVEMPVIRGGLTRRRLVLMAPHGTPIASVIKRSGYYDIDVVDETLRPVEGGEAPRGKSRLYEAAVAMVLAAKIAEERRPDMPNPDAVGVKAGWIGDA